MSQAITTKAKNVQAFLTELLVSIGRAEVCLDKNILDDPQRSACEDAINDLEAVFTTVFNDAEGSVIAALKAQKLILDEGIA